MQLAIEFEPIQPQWIVRINEMLNSVNENRKKKEVFIPLLQLQVTSRHIVFAAENDLSERVFNILTVEGETPANMCANWRNYAHIVADLKTFLRA